MRFISLDARNFYKTCNIQAFQDDIDGFKETLVFAMEDKD